MEIGILIALIIILLLIIVQYFINDKNQKKNLDLYTKFEEKVSREIQELNEDVSNKIISLEKNTEKNKTIIESKSQEFLNDHKSLLETSQKLLLDEYADFKNEFILKFDNLGVRYENLHKAVVDYLTKSNDNATNTFNTTESSTKYLKKELDQFIEKQNEIIQNTEKHYENIITEINNPLSLG